MKIKEYLTSLKKEVKAFDECKHEPKDEKDKAAYDLIRTLIDKAIEYGDQYSKTHSPFAISDILLQVDQLPEKVFGKNKQPAIVGPKSCALAELYVKHLNHFQDIKMPRLLKPAAKAVGFDLKAKKEEIAKQAKGLQAVIDVYKTSQTQTQAAEAKHEERPPSPLQRQGSFAKSKTDPNQSPAPLHQPAAEFSTPTMSAK